MLAMSKKEKENIQIKVSTDEELKKFLKQKGLLVLEVYSEWCGPCLGMVGSLEKVRNKMGGDNLHLAVCKADTISTLKRFRRKSKPVWIFVNKGKAVNMYSGSEGPELCKMIVEEMKLLSVPNRASYKIEKEIKR
ncbi:thioredoxin domain-containing protein 6-like [Teleopsis dalmanni]|uniref:thioredoxin domain-containing protein 6-like n=1 Tax=Teleopsis dalmanni TaxID=139649 RepID=UPI0018CF76BE|nr:thioredoxin domain-containing protein 6-like [Teleopsis dalmanni]